MITFTQALERRQTKRRLAKLQRARRPASGARRRKQAMYCGAACAVMLLALTACPVPTAAETRPEMKKTARAAWPGVPEAPEEPENAEIEAALLDRAQVIRGCAVTHYDACAACCGKTDGITASGVRAAPYITCAVDPDVIPLGADLLVDYGDGELHYYRADDVGAAVRGNHIDLCVSSHAEALALGIRTADVYWVEAEAS